MQQTRNPKARSGDLVIQILSDETLVYDLAAHEAHCLNETAAFVWSNCTGDVSIDEIAIAVEQRFGQRVNADFVRLALTQLQERDLLAESGLDAIPKLSRREAIRQIGLSSAVTIPVIASLVTPANALAALSCRIACTSPASCTIPACGNFCGGAGECTPTPVSVSVPI